MAFSTLPTSTLRQAAAVSHPAFSPTIKASKAPCFHSNGSATCPRGSTGKMGCGIRFITISRPRPTSATRQRTIASLPSGSTNPGEDPLRPLGSLDFDEDEIRKDIERLRKKEDVDKAVRSAGKARALLEEQERQNKPFKGIKEIVDKLLIADFFFVLGILLFLGAGVALTAATGDDSLYLVWASLWNPLFQPAIGALMAGALVSGAISFMGNDKGKQ